MQMNVRKQNIKLKRHGNLYPKIVEIENLKKAYNTAKSGKSNMPNVIKFSENAEHNLLQIQQSLINKTFTTSPYTTKQIYEPKKRTIYVLPFAPDRILQHALIQVVEPIWDNLFIYNSYACRKGKGIHLGSSKTMQYVQKYKYCLKCDISKFYPSVHQDIIFDIVQHKIKCKNTLWLMKDIIYSIPGGKNVPIGNYTSQWLGNLYLNELDTFVKQTCQIKPYLRYCDDFCIFSNDKQELHEMAEKMRIFLLDNLKLVYSKCDVFPVTQGVDFLGYRHFPNYILLRKSTAKRVKKRLSSLPELVESGIITIEQAKSTLASYNGWLKWANTNNLKISVDIENLIEKYRHT